MHEEERDFKDPWVEDSYAQDPLFPTVVWHHTASPNGLKKADNTPYNTYSRATMQSMREAQAVTENHLKKTREMLDEALATVFQQIMDRLDEIEARLP